MADGRNEKGDERGHRSADVRSRGGVDVATEEVVHGNVPFAGEFEPVGAVPPVGVEVSVAEAYICFSLAVMLLVKECKTRIWVLTGYFCKGAKHVFEDDEEYKEKGDHEGEEKHGDRLSYNESNFREVLSSLETRC